MPPYAKIIHTATGGLPIFDGHDDQYCTFNISKITSFIAKCTDLFLLLGDFLNSNPHLHAITTDGCFLDDGSFKVAPGFVLEDLEEIFQYEVLKMLKKEGKINDAVIENMY